MNAKMGRTKTLLALFFNMLYISAFTFGGGFVIVTLMKQKFVDKLHWMDESEMLDMTAIAQSSPGAIAVNAVHSRRLARGGLCRHADGRRRDDSPADGHPQRDFILL